MTDLGLEPRLRSLYRAEPAWAPAELRARVLAIPETLRPPRESVTGRSRTMALLVAAVLLAVLLVALGALGGAGWMRPPWQAQRSLTAPADVDLCGVIDGAFARLRGAAADGSGGGSVGPAGPFDHDGRTTAWGARVCAHGWDGGWGDPHLMLVPQPTSLEQAELLLASIFPSPLYRTAGWTMLAPGWWTATGVDRGTDFQMVAVSADPYFFVVTASEEQRGWWGNIVRPGALTLAAAVRAELGDPPTGR